MNIKEIMDTINFDKEKPAIVVAITMERSRVLDTNRDRVSIVLYTHRKLTLDGGDAHTGIDGIDVNHIHDVIYKALAETESLAVVHDIVVRPMPRIEFGASVASL